jgi:hypothetical protein
MLLKVLGGSTVCFFFFSLFALSPIHLFEKKDRWCPDIKFGSFCAHFGRVIKTKRHNMPPSVHYIPRACIHKICVWVASRCVWPSPDTSWSGNWAVKEQRSSTHCWLVLPFLVPSISHALWIWILEISFTWCCLGLIHNQHQIYLPHEFGQSESHQPLWAVCRKCFSATC